MLFFKMHSPNSIRESVNGVLSSHASNAFCIDINPSSCRTLGCRPTTSIVNKIISSGKEVR